MPSRHSFPYHPPNQMKLFSLTLQDKIKLAAELDGITVNDEILGCFNLNGFVIASLPSYSTSYDAIIPLIQKLGLTGYVNTFQETTKGITAIASQPSQLLDALLVATGKAEL